MKGGEKSNPAAFFASETSKIEDVGFRDALAKTLENSRIFSNIVQGQNSDYDLYVDILSQQRLRSGFLSFNAHLLVKYKLIERSSNNEVWKENIFSQFDAGSTPFTEGLSGASQKANEGAVRENLLQLVKKLRVFFTQAGAK